MRMDIGREAKYLEASIRRLISAVRRRYARPEEAEQGYGWWVLACGEPFKDAALAERDALRDRLRAEVEQAGIVLPELIWVWDEDNCVQLVITTLPTRTGPSAWPSGCGPRGCACAWRANGSDPREEHIYI